MLTYTDVVGLSRLAYKGRSKHSTNYLLAGRKWRVVQIFNHNGFRAITASGQGVNGTTLKVLAYSGSDVELNDWNMSGNGGAFVKGTSNTEQYQVGLKLASTEKPDYVVGHSLGGGLSLYSSVTLSIRAATVNPSPIFGLKFFKYSKNYPWAINYCVGGEMLAAGRKVGITPGQIVSVPTTAGTSYHAHLLASLSGFVEPVETR